MPKIVDHALRRETVAEIVMELIAEVGLEGVNVREIARRAQCSTAIISHYFANKHDLMLFAYRRALADTIDDVERRIAADEPIRACLEPMLPIGEGGVRGWKVWLSFWGKALSDEEFRHEQEQRSREALALVARVLACHRRPGDDRATEPLARLLLVTIVGLATQATYDPGRWPAAVQRATLDEQIAALGL
ncbi:TetR/AcrR family transcriptional regulator [Sphingomonas profundi]|uniref:TetR/AcrR family transcriptional regulator n=1 Tax=Alterirhizorhabdus profundi TaxID=2681549 RepID=UPI0012E9082E|nr:TetR/AcrR family transcriptional regulator [Sphingomonas profundi]